jgi:transposase-like protein
MNATNCDKCGYRPRNTANLIRCGFASYCAECNKVWRAQRKAGGKKGARVRVERETETMAELDAMIAEQRKRLPKWWSNCRAFVKGD